MGYIGYCYFQGTKTLRALSKIYSRTISGGWQAARTVLDSFHLYDITLEREERSGRSTCYIASRKTIRVLSSDFENPSLASVSRVLYVTADVLRHMEGYAMVYFKPMFERFLRIAGAFSILLILSSFITGNRYIFSYGAALFAADVFMIWLLLRRKQRVCQKLLDRLMEKKIFPEREWELIINGVEAVRMVQCGIPFQLLITMWKILKKRIGKYISRPAGKY